MANANRGIPPQQSRPDHGPAKLWMIGADLTLVDCSTHCNSRTDTRVRAGAGALGPSSTALDK